MSANTFGQRFCVTTFGESHGSALGCVIDGCPAGISFDHDLLVRELDRRRPGTSATVSARQEADVPEVVSGVFEGTTLGTPIAIIVRNRDARPGDYRDVAANPRPGHADDVWKEKFGHGDPRGGGRASGRETVARVMAGAVAQMIARQLVPDLTVSAFASQMGPLVLTCDNPKTKEVESLLMQAKEEGKSYGGEVTLWIDHAPAGLGQPVFHKFKSDLASALLGIGAATAVEMGEGFASTQEEGTAFHRRSGQEQYGGIRGGITTGERIIARVGFKPTSSVLDVARRGRHDPCIVPRAVPVIEAMAWLVVVDHVLWGRTDRAV
ncbi:MAG: chorismate synthase [Deltaproteobacteria bacterium]|nr:chorismate synthase [Deltaproteobacteria bacterium]